MSIRYIGHEYTDHDRLPRFIERYEPSLAAALERDERIARTAFVASAGCPHAGILARIWLGRN